MVLVGFGVGFSFSLLPAASMHEMDYRYRGSANSTNSFFPFARPCIGYYNFWCDSNEIASKRNGQLVSQNLAETDRAGQNHSEIYKPVFQPETRVNIPPDILDVIVNAMSTSISATYLWSLIPVGIAVIAVFYMGNDRLDVTKKP